MKLHYWRSSHGNFGDELNAWLWHEFAPDLWDENDSATFVGIGTILDDEVPAKGLKIVLGAGAGYAPIPAHFSENTKEWRFYGVRGPLTARLFDLPPELALTDPAILLTTLPRFQFKERKGVSFVPHWKSVGHGAWKALCDELEIQYINPCDDMESVIRRIGTSELVLAESLHAAVVADTLRVPWIPIATSPEISPFKWADWTLSLRLPYRPACLAPSSWREEVRNIISKISHRRAFFDPALFARNSPMTQLEFSSAEDLFENYETIMRRSRQNWRQTMAKGAEALAKRLMHDPTMPEMNGYYQEAKSQLQKVLTLSPTLSADTTHRDRLNATLAAVEKMKKDFALRSTASGAL